MRRGRQAQQRLKFYMSTFEKRFAILGHRGRRFTTGALRQMCAARINIVIRETITSRTKVLRRLIVPPVISHFVFFEATQTCVCIQLRSMIACYYSSWESREQQALRGKTHSTNSFEFYPITVGKSGQSCVTYIYKQILLLKTKKATSPMFWWWWGGGHAPHATW